MDLWAGLGGSPSTAPTKAGVIVACINGVAHYLAFVQASPLSSEQPVPGLFTELHPGQHVKVSLVWGYTTHNAFTAYFSITEPNHPDIVVQHAFDTTPQSGANRTASLCSLERSGTSQIPKFDNFTAGCSGGLDLYIPIPSARTATSFTNLQTSAGKILASSRATSDGVIAFRWIDGS
jgi:hypothetical protein